MSKDAVCYFIISAHEQTEIEVGGLAIMERVEVFKNLQGNALKSLKIYRGTHEVFKNLQGNA